jgi:hypothetical protein
MIVTNDTNEIYTSVINEKSTLMELSTLMKLASKRDPVFFARYLLRFNPDKWQADFLRSKAGLILLNCTRQSGKSTSAAILALWLFMFFPGQLIILVSPSERQSQEIFRKIKNFYNGLAPIFKIQLKADNTTSMEGVNNSRIVSLPESEGTIRGYSAANVIIEDEAARVSDALSMAVEPMLAVSHGRYIQMSTPYGRIGHFFVNYHNPNIIAEKYEVPWHQCPRISKDFIASYRAKFGDSLTRQEFECQFEETLDQVISNTQILAALPREEDVVFSVPGLEM